MGSFGERLRRQREMRGISLDEIVATTKIGRRLLTALEEEQFDLLPGGIFNKAYVRAYAKCVGIDEDEAVAEYLEAAQEQAPDTRVIAQQHASIYSDRRPESSGFPLVPVLILLVVAVSAIAGWKAYQEHLREREQRLVVAKPAENPTASSASSEQQAAANPPAASPGAGQTAASTPAQSASSAHASPLQPERPSVSSAQAGIAGNSFELTIRPKDRAWVSVKSDGKYVIRGIIKPPDVKSVHATSEVVFYTGNAGAVDLAFNGKNVPLSGGPNQEQTLVFDSRGVMPRVPAQ